MEDNPNRKVIGLFPLLNLSLIPSCVVNRNVLSQNKEKAKKVSWEKEGEEVNY